MIKNMAKDNVYIGDDARNVLMVGVNKVANAVKGTLGAGGYNALIADPRPPFSVATNDGISVAKSIFLTDPIEQMGANLMREIGSKSEKDGGDGTTTSITLAQAILKEGEQSQSSPMDIKRSLEECLPAILKSIDDQTKPITVDEVGAVASISAEDEKIGALIQEVYQKIGKDGILYTDVSRGTKDYYTVGSGVKIEGAGLVSPYMSDTADDGNFTKSVVIKNPKILVTKQPLNGALQLEALANALAPEGIKDLIIFCDEVNKTVVPELIQTRAKAHFRVVLVKLPVIWKDQWFEDVAKMTGATVLDPALGIGYKEAHINYLGTCETLTIDKHDTYFEGIKDISDHIKELEAGDDDAKIRAARLNTKTARLFVGAHSDSALSYKRLKLEDARNAAWQALHGGIVPGGGVALFNASLVMPETPGGNVLRKALKAPLIQIAANADVQLPPAQGFDGLSFSGPTLGINAKTGEVEDMFEAGIVDAAEVTKNVVRNALSVAAIILTTKVIVTPPEIPGMQVANDPNQRMI